MGRVLKLALACVLLAGVSAAQEQTPPPQGSDAKPDPSIIKEFTRSAKLNGMIMSFVLVTDKTADVLFQAPGKYAIKARARMGTLFYVQATPENDVKQLDMKYTMEQDGQSVGGTALNIKNFEGGAVTKGNRIDGLLQFDKKIDPSRPFRIINDNSGVEFQLSPEALKTMGL